MAITANNDLSAKRRWKIQFIIRYSDRLVTASAIVMQPRKRDRNDK